MLAGAAATVLCLLVWPAGAAGGPEFSNEQAVQHSQAAIGRTVDAEGFQDRDERPVDLARFRGKPLVISMVYTSCYHTCPLITQALERSVIAAQGTFGADGFSVLTVGFDTREDSPKRMRAYAAERGIRVDNWHFLSATPDAVKRLSDSLGFIFYPSPRGFDHLAQTTVVDEQGKVYAQIYGAEFTPPALVEPLKALIFGTGAPLVSVEGIVQRIRLFCTIYDPRSDRYRFDYSIFVGLIIGAFCLLGIATIIGRNAWRLWSDGRSA
ncbi:MAG: SCO family protein [Hyphomicrobiales bacterium]